MNLIDLIPGDRINGEQFDIIQKNIMEAINPGKIPPNELFTKLELKLKEEVIDLLQSNITDMYYILYTHPINENCNRLFVSKKDIFLQYINNCFNEERGDGIDIIISDMLYETLIIGNHDGMLLEVPRNK